MARSRDRTVEFVRPHDDLDFDRPFWPTTIEGLTEADKSGRLDKVEVTFDQLRNAVDSRTPQTKGMVFHIGRCGSTLVSRMIGHDSSKLVLREPSPIGDLHRGSGTNRKVPTFTIEQAFKDVLVAFDAFASSKGPSTKGQGTIVKHSSWESFSAGRIAELLPATPCVFVYRNPIETVESSLDGHPAWAVRLHQPRNALQRWIPWLDGMKQPFTAAALYAAVWASGAAAALDVPSERMLLVDHAKLMSSPRQTLDALVSHLDLSLDPEAALAELGQYSKAQTDGTAFEPQGAHSHPHLSARTRAHVLDIVGDLPERLAKRLVEQEQQIATVK